MELLVVLAVLGLVLALAVPSLGRSLPGFALRSDVRTVASALKEARAAAIGQNRETTLILDVEQRTLRLGERAMVKLNPKVAISIEGAAPEASEVAGISFFPDGSSTGGRVTLALGERKQHVVVDWLTGTISVAE
jgi:general secretion pathway protein H